MKLICDIFLRIRLMAIDHGLFSFIDAPHGRWPLILITNPKHALYAMPKREAAASEQSALSTHIRLLAFSIGKITHVKVRINEQPWTKAKNVKGNTITILRIRLTLESGKGKHNDHF